MLGCDTCISDAICLKCSDGYYMGDDNKTCIKCKYPCENCISDTYCISCGYEKDKRVNPPNCGCLNNFTESNDASLGCLLCVNGYTFTDS